MKKGIVFCFIISFITLLPLISKAGDSTAVTVTPKYATLSLVYTGVGDGFRYMLLLMEKCVGWKRKEK